MLRLALFQLGMAIIPWLPRKLAYLGAHSFTNLLTLFGSSAFRASLENQAAVHGLAITDPTVRATAQRALKNQALNYIDLLQLDHSQADSLVKRISVSGYGNLQQAQEAGKGVLIISGHIGNLDFVGQLLALRGLSTVVPVERIQPKRLFQYVSALRSRHGLQLVAADDALRPVLRELRQGGIVTLISDWDRQGNGTPVRFFGRPTNLPAAAAVLHLRTGAPIVPCFAARLGNGNYTARVEHSLDLSLTGVVEQDIPAIMQGVAASLETAIKRDPSQWVLFHRVWP